MHASIPDPSAMPKSVWEMLFPPVELHSTRSSDLLGVAFDICKCPTRIKDKRATGLCPPVMLACFRGCVTLKRLKRTPGYEEPTILATETCFTVSEVEALYELFKKISSSIIKDGLIHKEEFQLALFRNSNKKNLFADRIFDLFDIKRNGVIEFGEFVRSLSVFHPSAPVADKTAFAFRLYDLRQTGFIEREELKEMVLALLKESELILSDDVVELIVEQTFRQADGKGDGRIDLDEWKEFVGKNPSLLKNMTLPYLKDITLAFPSFVLKSDAEDADMST